MKAFEIGNEPDMYTTHSDFQNLDGTPIYIRPQGFDWTMYLQEFASYASAISPYLPSGAVLAGPGASTSPFLLNPAQLRQVAPVLD